MSTMGISLRLFRKSSMLSLVSHVTIEVHRGLCSCLGNLSANITRERSNSCQSVNPYLFVTSRQADLAGKMAVLVFGGLLVTVRRYEMSKKPNTNKLNEITQISSATYSLNLSR